MAISQAEINFVMKTSAMAQTLMDLYGNLTVLNQLWAGPNAFNTGITQADLDNYPAFADIGLTTQQLADVEYTLGLILGNLNNQLSGLSIVGSIPALP